MSGIFLDRDGVIIRKAAAGEYIRTVDEMEFLPGSAEAIAALSRFGFRIIVVTNQRGVAVGKIRVGDLEEIHERLKHVVASRGGEISDVFYCPHDVSEGCTCRKPKTGMLLRAAEEHRLPLAECWMIGDAATDITAGRSAGCKTALLTQSQEFLSWVDQPDIWAESLACLAERILGLVSRKMITNNGSQSVA
jgi:D-glycero-D-manno-heptose 1,7-bisphosphate phosphatase